MVYSWQGFDVDVALNGCGKNVKTCVLISRLLAERKSVLLKVGCGP